MLLRLIKSNSPLIFFVIPLVGLLLWLQSWLNPAPILNTYATMPLYDLVISITGTSGYIPLLLNFFLVLLAGYFIAKLNSKYIFIQDRTQMPALFFILLAGSMPALRTINPVIFSLLFLLWAIDRMIGTYRMDQLSYHPFEAGILIGLATLFYAPSAIFIILLWISMILFRPGYWREWAFTLLGLATPVLFLCSWAFLSDIPLGRYSQMFIDALISGTPEHYTASELLWISFLLILVLLASHLIIQTFQSKKILARRSFTLFFWWFLVILAAFFLIHSAGSELMIILAVPLSYLFSHFFMYIRRRWWGETLLWIMIILIVELQL